MSLYLKAIISGFSTGILGLILVLTPFGLNLEENLGFDLLFTLRGARQAPSEVIVISIDKVSAEKLNLPDNPSKWPRYIHSQLIENLSREDVTVIAFDLFFHEARSAKDDNLLANAMNKAGNVILSAYLMSDIPIDESGTVIENVHIVKCVHPIPALAKSACAVACFPLPKVPFKVMRYWTFKRAAGDEPTLPVVMLQSYALEVYDEFAQLLQKSSSARIEDLPPDKDIVINTKGIKNVVKSLRHIFEKDPSIAEKMLENLHHSKTLFVDSRKEQLIRSLIKMYQAENSQYLNFYGPPRTITTVPYYQALQQIRTPSAGRHQPNFNKKAVLVGLSENMQSEKKNDGYITAFSQSGEIGISGVEIAATAFANLLEDRPVHQLSFPIYLAIIFLWGLFIGTFCRFTFTDKCAMCVTGMVMLYAMSVFYQFKINSTYYPFIVPLFFQAPFAFLSTLVWKYIESNKERKHIKEAFKYYMPPEVVEQLTRDIGNVKADTKLVTGVCLCTDAENYTSLSETMDPKELSSFMNKYYETIFEPIKQHGGVVSNVIADSMLALWASVQSDSALSNQAVRAALAVKNSVNRFNQTSGINLPTRIGLHSGHILLGNIGAIDHYEYRPVGDIVNTGSRLEGLNKYLGTKILASEDMMKQLDGILTRRLGEFLLAGKSKPIVVHEVICLIDEANQQQRNLCVHFYEAFDAFKNQSWEEAINKFNTIIKIYGEDGPSLFYIEKCRQYKGKQSEKPLEGVVCMEKK